MTHRFEVCACWIRTKRRREDFGHLKWRRIGGSETFSEAWALLQDRLERLPLRLLAKGRNNRRRIEFVNFRLKLAMLVRTAGEGTAGWRIVGYREKWNVQEEK